ncbi:MAG: lectin like domain-containing protein, partial [Thermoleophilia bacterium]
QAFVQALRDPAAWAGGRLPNPVRMRVGAAAESTARRAAGLPARYDLRLEARLTPVKDQAQYNTCWAFANVAALESSLLGLQPPELWDLSEDNLVSRSGFGPFLAGLYQYGGYDAMAVAYFTRWAGPVDEGDDPYPSRTPPAVNVARKHVQDVVMLPGRASAGDNDLLKRLVMEYGGVSVGMYWDPDGEAFDSATGSYYAPGINQENHGVAIVGWDDAYGAAEFGGGLGEPPGDGAYLVRNSWGTGFGDGGYFYVSYYDLSFAFSDCTAYTRVDAPGVYRKVYQYDRLGLVEARRLSGVGDPSTARFANRFTANRTQRVVAAGFYATAGGASYTVFAGPSFTQLSARGSGTLELPGFHTVPLTTPLRVVKGRRFVVAVKLTTPGAEPLPIERPRLPYSSLASASPGQSYVKSPTSRWYDLTSLKGMSEANVCLKAYAVD